MPRMDPSIVRTWFWYLGAVLTFALPSATLGQVPELVPFPLLQGPDGAAFVAADQPTTTLYTPSTRYQWNSAGMPSFVLRTGVGEYIVKTPGLGCLGGNVQITAYGASAARCKVAAWLGFGPVLATSVRCFLGDDPVDSQFILSFERLSRAGEGVSYAWAPLPPANAGPTYPAPPTYALGFNSFYRTQRFETPLPSQPGLLHVTGYGLGSEHCIVTVVSDVACFDANGTNVRAPYSVTKHDQRVANAGRLGAYVSFDFAFPASVPDWPRFPTRQFGTSMPIRATRLGTGNYRIFLPGMPAADAAVPLVSGYDIETSGGEKSVHCKPFAWFPLEGETVVDVRCFTLGGANDGQPRDAQFNLSYLTNR